MTTTAEPLAHRVFPMLPLPRVVSPDEWRTERLRLLAREKELTRARDVLNEERRALPAVLVRKDYAFETATGPARLIDLFEGRRQLIVYHFMFHRETGEGCSGCSHLADNVPHLAHLNARDTTLVFVSRAPLAEIEPFKRRMGWLVPWHSSWGSDFNYDFHVTLDESVAPLEYNYRTGPALEASGLPPHFAGELHGVSVFLRDGDRVLHTYSTYARGPEPMLATYAWLDITPFGRGEGWDGMPNLGIPLRHHDRYDA